LKAKRERLNRGEGGKRDVVRRLEGGRERGDASSTKDPAVPSATRIKKGVPLGQRKRGREKTVGKKGKRASGRYAPHRTRGGGD